MPEYNVNIEVEFEKIELINNDNTNNIENPKTLDNIHLLLISLFSSLLGIIIITKHKYQANHN